jgi:tRNA1(Val) A37 N6-methylase TrmN6
MQKVLGQVFTKKIIADHMVSLFTLSKDSTVLDPCFGEGVFIKSLLQQRMYRLIGCEIDTTLYEPFKTQHDGLELFNVDFLLNYTPDRVIDGAILNPPYIRQEEIKNKDKLRQVEIFRELPTVANMYMYFVMKVISLVRNGGEIIAIIPDSWLKAKSGEAFTKAINRHCLVQQMEYVKGKPFETDVNTNVVIIKLIKTNDKDKLTNKSCIKISEHGIVKQACLKEIFLNGDICRLESVSTVKRGISTGYNIAFVNPRIKGCKECLVKVLSTPRNVKGYSSDYATLDDILNISDKDISKCSELKSYLDEISRKIIVSKRPKSLYDIIASGGAWYKIRIPSKNPDIIFSYIIRDNVRFIRNTADVCVRDNFYGITTALDPMFLMALLNNYYTFYQLEVFGKQYGNGLLKVQKHDIDSVMVVTPENVSANDRVSLISLAKTLVETGEEQFIRRITDVLATYMDVTSEDIYGAYSRIKNNRLEKLV